MKSVNKTESDQRKSCKDIKSRLLWMKKMMNEDGRYPFSTISKKISIYL
jgi:hypothetical protein